MKPTTNIILAAALAVALHVPVASANFLPAPLPKFRTKEGFAHQRGADPALQGARTAAAKEVGVFFTGKPFDSGQKGYLFKYRSYDPEINRWTTVDPSGFPDGANDKFYAPVPTSAIDPFGLSSWRFDLPTTFYGVGNSNQGIVNVGGHGDATLTVDASLYSNNVFSQGLTSASLLASGNAWLLNRHVQVGLDNIGISVNTATGELFVSQGNGDPSSNQGYTGLGQSLTTTYSSDRKMVEILYTTSGIYSGGGFTGASGGGTVWAIGVSGGGSWSNAPGAPVATQVSLVVYSYE